MGWDGPPTLPYRILETALRFWKKKKKRETLLNSEKKNSGNVFNLLMSGSSLQIWGRWVAMVLPQSKYCLFPLTRTCKKQKLGWSFLFENRGLVNSWSLCNLSLHFLVTEEKKAMLQEIANQKGVSCRAQGWKVHLCAAQLLQLVGEGDSPATYSTGEHGVV